MKRVLKITFLLLLCIASANSQSYENLQVSLLTVKPRPNEVYTVFGHTALRVNNPDRNADVVFNWGTFNFRTPNFIFLFMKGETDYFLSTTDYDSFCANYSWDDSTVIEQVLDFTEEEKTTLMNLLVHNLQPENKEYRYNYIFDNCTTRVRDLISQSYNSQIEYAEQGNPTTFRKLIHTCTDPYPWLTFGIDLIIGSGADSLISRSNEMFLPEQLMLAMDGASVDRDDGQCLKVVSETTTIMESSYQDEIQPKPMNMPMIVGLLLLAICLVVVVLSYKKKRMFKLFFSFLFLVFGLGGCIVAFMCFCSVHPCVWPNWNILWLHPLHLFVVVGCFWKKTYPVFYWYHLLNFVFLCVLLLAWFLIPQGFNPANIPYVLSLGMVSGYMAYWLKSKKHE